MKKSLLFSTILCSVITRADIVTDGSMGAAQSLVGPHFAITAELGRQRGANLFHSFQQFSIAKDERATFSGPDAIVNIIGRVTGGSPSAIDGQLYSSIRGANLFLLNPAGVLFGLDASVNISGSLHITTADYLQFDDNQQLLAALGADSQLTTAAPAAFGFLDPGATGTIQIRGTQLALSTDNALLTVVANGVTLEDAALNVAGYDHDQQSRYRDRRYRHRRYR